MAREAVEQLSLEGLQSDRRFLESFVRGRVAKGYGEARIRQELRFKGISREDMDEVLRAYDWDGLLVEVYVKKYGHSAPPIHQGEGGPPSIPAAEGIRGVCHRQPAAAFAPR